MEKMSFRQMRKIAQPPSMISKDPFSNFFWIRKCSIYFSWIFVRIGLSADQVLIMSGVSGLIGVCCLAMKTDWLRVTGGVLVFLSIFLDFCDGEVARLNNQSSIRGIWHDRVWHEIVLPLLWLLFGYGQYATTGSEFYLFLGFVMTVFGPWPSEIDERAKQVTLAIVVTRDGLPRSTNNINASEGNEPQEEAKEKEKEKEKDFTGYLKKAMIAIKFPIKCYELIGQLSLWFMISAIIDVFWNGVVVFGLTITAEGTYIIISNILTVPFSVKNIIISGKNREVEKFIEHASKKVPTK